MTDGTRLNEEFPTTFVQSENSGNILISVDLIVLNYNWRGGGCFFILNTNFYDINKGSGYGNHMFVMDGT